MRERPTRKTRKRWRVWKRKHRPKVVVDAAVVAEHKAAVADRARVVVANAAVHQAEPVQAVVQAVEEDKS